MAEEDSGMSIDTAAQCLGKKHHYSAEEADPLEACL